MLYEPIRRRKTDIAPAPLPLHYFDAAEMLQHLQTEGHTWAEMARMTGLTVPQAMARVRLLQLDVGLRDYLRREHAPEKIALLLLSLPDPVTQRRMAHRIARERLCIRDAALLVRSAQRHCRAMQEETPAPQRVITAIRDVRLYRNAIRDIAEQMKTAGVRASFSERRTGGMQELTVAYPTRRRRTERYQSMYT